MAIRQQEGQCCQGVPVLRICEDLANGAKHLKPPRDKRSQNVQKSGRRSAWVEGVWSEGVWAPGTWDYLVVQLNGAAKVKYGAELTIVQLADEVMKFFWSTEGGCPPTT
jgi:hypothetical protein